MYLVILVLPIISVTPYISLHLQVDPYPFLFGSPARCALVLVYLLYNKLNSLDPLLVLHSALLHLLTFRRIAVALTAEKDNTESQSWKQLCILPVASDSHWTPLTAIYAPSKIPSPPRPQHATSDCHAAF